MIVAVICPALLVCPTMTKPHPLRFVGASGTYAAGLALRVAALATL